MRKKIVLVVIFLILIISCQKSKTLKIEDFNTGALEEWTAKGNAFADGISKGEKHYMVGFMGKGFISSFNSEIHPSIGSLTSDPFIIKKNSIHFMLGAHEISFLNRDIQARKELAIQLIVDGEIVRTSVPEKPEFHAMFWEGWNVEEFKGKTGKIRIVDDDNREWAHIDVDQIVQTDLPEGGLLLERKMAVPHSKLKFPVNEKYPRYYVEIYAGGQQVRGIDVALAPKNDVDYWVVNDLSKWCGQEIEIRTRQYGEYDPDILDNLKFADSIIASDNLYDEQLRSQIHFSAKRGWLNDPNGLVYYDGEFHLFYQANPYGWDHSRNDYNKTWGHAVSRDLVHWKELPGAIHPDSLGSIYSGSAIVDKRNTTGFKSGKEDPIVCVYTSAGGRNKWSDKKKFTQSLSYSNDRGRTFTKYKNNPVQENIEYINRDPKVIWHEPSNRWVIVLHFNDRAMGFFTSKDLKTWEFQSEFESKELIDCPELFQLPVDGDPQNKKWILYGGSGDYLIGEFDGKKFTSETDLMQYSYGNCFYASQTFNNVPGSDGRRIQMGWGTIDTPGMPFNQILLFPVNLTLHSTEEGLRMFAYPIKEIEKLHKKDHQWREYVIQPGVTDLPNLDGKLFDINAEFETGGSEEFGIIINGQKIGYNTKSNKLTTEDTEALLKPRDGKINLRILVDRVSLEIYANEGKIYMPIRANYNNSKNGIKLFTKGNETEISSLIIHELKSIWKK